MPVAGCTGWRCRPLLTDPLEALAFRALVSDHSSSPMVRPAVVERGRHSIEIKPSQATPWCLTITRPQPFARPQSGGVSEKGAGQGLAAGGRTRTGWRWHRRVLPAETGR